MSMVENMMKWGKLKIFEFFKMFIENISFILCLNRHPESEVGLPTNVTQT